ncbi:MAG: histidine phosphatase family protein [Intrasporangium sp.]|uniref:histidine phosphatase family protein n=1 Tax=Intrasporangium sp. TaxID=1925024 RepID=UPI002647060B|nr:histidine phosphatase family protein [Intrasporangium sp.]MDN5797515.1 histidine phosphatase family protein [Intrasporangium sp.]
MSGTGPGPRRVVIMRHAETVDNAARIWQGHKDTELSEVGREQVVAAAPHLAAYEPVLLISSDLQRAASTADPIAEITGLEVRLDARFREIDVGEWQGLHSDEVREQYADVIAALDRGEDVPKGRTGETRAEVATRVTAAVEDVLRELLPGETAVIVAHGASGKLAATELVGLDLGLADRVFRGLDNCHWIELVQDRSRFSGAHHWRIAGWNLGPWDV